MTTRLSSKGQVVLPAALRRRLGLRAGDELTASIAGGVIKLAPLRAGKCRPRIVRDPITGVPVISAGPGAPVLTSEEVAERLADFP